MKRSLTVKSWRSMNPAGHRSAAYRISRRSNECALAAANLDKVAAHKVLNRPTDGDATDPESRNEFVFRGQLVAYLQVPTRNLASQDCFDARIKKRVVCR
jgi:hypothetical protein